MNGEFIGGCDILLEMHKSGDFIEELKKVGIKSALLTEKKEAEWVLSVMVVALHVNIIIMQCDSQGRKVNL